MQKSKKSFFERLTGAVKIPDDELADREHPMFSKNISEESEDEIIDEGEGQLTIDVHQTANDIVIKTMVAGVKPEDLDINITRDMVTIKGHREAERTVDSADYFHRELYWGSFSRTILLPQEIEVEEAEAIEKHGLLIIRLPKIDKNKQTKLRVKNNN